MPDKPPSPAPASRGVAAAGAPGSAMQLLQGAILIVAVLYFARDLLIPLVLAILLSFVLAPVARALRRVWLPRPVAVLVAGTFAGAPFGFLYDLPAVTAAGAMLLVARPEKGWRLVDDAIVALAVAVPAILTLTSRFYWTGGVAMVLLFALSFVRAAPWRGRR